MNEKRWVLDEKRWRKVILESMKYGTAEEIEMETKTNTTNFDDWIEYRKVIQWYLQETSKSS